jgi:hypothetical protein
MKTYRICITRSITESAFVEVNAESEEDAQDIAYDKRMSVEYEVDDCEPSDYYINTVEEME